LGRGCMGRCAEERRIRISASEGRSQGKVAGGLANWLGVGWVLKGWHFVSTTAGGGSYERKLGGWGEKHATHPSH